MPNEISAAWHFTPEADGLDVARKFGIGEGDKRLKTAPQNPREQNRLKSDISGVCGNNPQV